MNVDNYGFIITRHVTSEKTNKYWNRCIRCIRKFYPLKKIIVIDDNSRQEFVKAETDYDNVVIIQSEFPGRGELLPYYYFYKNKFFNNAVIIHDSVFFHKGINFDLVKIKAIPLWHFDLDKENYSNSIRLANALSNNNEILKKLSGQDFQFSLVKREKWNGCFGCQSYINHDFLSKIENKYKIFNLLRVIKNRTDRCCLERILGVILFTEQKFLFQTPSLFGNIWKSGIWNLSYEKYLNELEKKNGVPLPVMKVWTGR